MGAFGEKLRQQRERRGLSLEAISTTTKISTRMLRAIEDERFDQLPGGVFNKGFVRAYARQVGLNEEEAITAYLTALRDGQLQSQSILSNFRTSNAKSPAIDADRRYPAENAPTFPDSPTVESTEDRRTAQRRIEERRNQNRRSEDRHTEPGPHEVSSSEIHSDENLGENFPSSPPSFLNLSAPSSEFQQPTNPDQYSTRASAADNSFRVPWEKLAAALVVITLALAFWTLHRRSQSATASQAAASNQSQNPIVAVATPADAPSAPASSPKHARTPQTAFSTTGSVSTPADSDVNPPVASSRVHTPKPKSPPPFTLFIRAAQTSWVSVTADGEPEAKETLIAPAVTSVRATREIVVKTGNAAAISFLFNGKEIPASGDSGEVRTYTFDATGLRP